MTVRVGSIGGWGHLGSVFKDFAAVEGLEFVAYAPAFEGEALDAIRVQAGFGEQTRFYDDCEVMLAGAKVEVVVISSRLDCIARAALAAVKAGCHCIVEKPLALDRKDLAELHAEAVKQGVLCTGIFNMRAMAAFRKAREIYQSGAIGEAVMVNGRKSYGWGDSRPQWFGEQEKYGSTLSWVGIHALDFINYITDLTYTSVVAMQGNFSRPNYPDCQDHGGVLFGLSNGGHGTVSIDYLRPKAAKTHGDDWVRIVGTEGTIEASHANAYCKVLTHEVAEQCYDLTGIEPVNMFAHFIGRIQKKTAFDIPDGMSFHLTDVALAGFESQQSCKVIQLDSGKWL